MHQAIDRRGRRHLIAEDPIPLREDQIARDEDRAALVAFGEEREENLGLLGALLDVAHVVEDQHREVIELAQGARQLEIPLRRQELLHEAVGRHEEHGVAAVDERVADGAHRVALADARQAEGQAHWSRRRGSRPRRARGVDAPAPAASGLHRACRTFCPAAASTPGASA